MGGTSAFGPRHGEAALARRPARLRARPSRDTVALGSFHPRSDWQAAARGARARQAPNGRTSRNRSCRGFHACRAALALLATAALAAPVRRRLCGELFPASWPGARSAPPEARRGAFQDEAGIACGRRVGRLAAAFPDYRLVRADGHVFVADAAALAPLSRFFLGDIRFPLRGRTARRSRAKRRQPLRVRPAACGACVACSGLRRVPVENGRNSCGPPRRLLRALRPACESGCTIGTYHDGIARSRRCFRCYTASGVLSGGLSLVLKAASRPGRSFKHIPRQREIAALV